MRGVWFRSGSQLKYTAFKSGIYGFSSSPLVKVEVMHPKPQRGTVLHCRDVFFLSGTFPLPVSPSTSRSTGHFAEAYECTSVGESYLSKQCWKKILFLIRSVCGLQNRVSNSISEQKYTKSSSAIFDLVLKQFGIILIT